VGEPAAACITLAEPIDFDAPDRQRVDVLFVLLVPRDCNEAHLRLLAKLAEMFNESGLRDSLRTLDDPQSVIDTLARWAPAPGRDDARSAG